jgi:hypothetical protein
MNIRSTVTVAIAAAGLCVAGLGVFAAGPASAATTSVKNHIKHPIKAVTVCSAKGQLGWTAAGKRYLCKKPSGWRFYRWVPDPVTPPAPPAPPVPPVLGITPWQQIQTWAVTSGNAAWYQVFHTDTDLLAAAEATTPTVLAGPFGDVLVTDTTPLVPLQDTISADAQDLVTDAQAALAAPAPGNFTASWDAIMTDQVTYGNYIAANPGDWGAYSFSQPDATAAYGTAGSDDLTAIEAVPVTAPSLTTILTLTPDVILDNAVILWADGPGAAAKTGFGTLDTSYYPLTAGSYPTGNGTAIVADADAALAAPAPGSLSAPFIALADEYVTIGQQIEADLAVTANMVIDLNADAAVWNAALLADGPQVPTWIANF